VLSLIRSGLVQSAHDCADGGLAVALAECCISSEDRRLGAVVTLPIGRLRRDAVMFGESQSRVVLSATAANREAVLEHARQRSVPAEVIGGVGGARFVAYLRDAHSTTKTIDAPISALYESWANSLERTLAQE
jgi:phosphoribosylformylglycinamidine synthase